MGRRGGDSWESFQHWANCGNSWALCQPFGGRGSSELVLWVHQAGAGVACRLPQRLAAAPVSGEKLLWTEQWSSKRLAQRVGTGSWWPFDSRWHERIWHMSDICWCCWLGGGGGVPAYIKGEGKSDLWISKDKGGLGENWWEEEEPLWEGKLAISVSHVAISAVLILDAAKYTAIFGDHGYRPTLGASGWPELGWYQPVPQPAQTGFHRW